MEEPGGSEAEEGMAPGGEDFNHRNEDEFAQMHAGVGERWMGVGGRGDGTVADEVDVDGAVGV